MPFGFGAIFEFWLAGLVLGIGVSAQRGETLPQRWCFNQMLTIMPR